jgi:hypothetical protein
MLNPFRKVRKMMNDLRNAKEGLEKAVEDQTVVSERMKKVREEEKEQHCEINNLIAKIVSKVR